MCSCNNHQHNEIVVLKYSSLSSIVVDKCIADEIEWLHSIRIETTGCCCGHNKGNQYIRVVDKDAVRMLFLGYQLRVHPYDSTLHNTFSPLSV